MKDGLRNTEALHEPCANRSGWERGGKSVTPRETTFPQSCGNSVTGRLLGIGGAAPITIIMHQSKDLIELDP